ncbi:AMP-binding protein [Parabacteroides distasonis]|uniref:AMP-binding protein n=1 Tax=Parabacteroides distasonis TaxID=823 RepID=UPI0039B68241
MIEIYQPEYLWLPESMMENCRYGEKIFGKYHYALLRIGRTSFPMYPDLSLLLPTSGTTGSPKLVRHSYENLEASALNVATLFELTSNQRAMGTLPMHYTMGLSVVSSHLLVGAMVILSNRSLLDGEYWEMVKRYKATSFTGVPYSYEILTRLRFARMRLPDMQIITQGGGKMTEEQFRLYAEYAKNNGKKFIPTYGQTEGTSRMAYLPHPLAQSKVCCIGIAVPNGKLSVIDDNGVEIMEPEAEGEMVYEGKNVTLGYATCGEDLIKGDENHGVLHTGDMVRRDADGCYFIIGRKKRFLKIYGLRIGLDEIETLVKERFKTDCVCMGNDELLKIVITAASGDDVVRFIEEKTGLFHQCIKVIKLEAIPHAESGKVDMNKLNGL